MNSAGNRFNIVGMGELLWDLLPAGKQLGGAPANFAYHAQSLGAQSFIVSSLGQDELGSEILKILQSIDLNCKYIQDDKKHPTGTVEVKLDENGVPDFTIHKNVAWDHIYSNEKLLELAKHTDAVCFGTLAQRSAISRETIQTFLKATNPKCLRVYDINLRQDYYNIELVKNSLDLSNCLKLNEDELPVVAKLLGINGNEDEILHKLLKKYELQLIVLTKGENGSFLYNSSGKTFRKTPKVKVADTVGAGDSFTAAIILGILKKLPLEQIHTNAVKLSAYVCTQKGATPPLSESLKEELLA